LQQSQKTRLRLRRRRRFDSSRFKYITLCGAVTITIGPRNRPASAVIALYIAIIAVSSHPRPQQRRYGPQCRSNIASNAGWQRQENHNNYKTKTRKTFTRFSVFGLFGGFFLRFSCLFLSCSFETRICPDTLTATHTRARRIVVQGIWNLDYLETANYLVFTLLRGQSSGSLSAYRQLSVVHPWRAVLGSVRALCCSVTIVLSQVHHPLAVRCGIF